MNRNKKILLSIISIIAIIALGTYAWIIWNSPNNTAMTMEIGQLAEVSFKTGNDISTTVMGPVLDPLTDGEITTFSVKNKADYDYAIDININITAIDNALKDESFKYMILSSTTENGTYTEVVSDNFSNITTGNNTILDTTITASTTTYYKFIMYIDGSMENDPSMMNKSISGTLNVSAMGSDFPEFILNSNAPLDSVNSTYVQNTIPGIDFTQPSSDTNGKGLYIRSGTENNIKPIYYYRGAVDNNNVYFANYCWKIVRTTETGGLKMIYNGTPTSGSCGSGVESQSNSTIGNSAYNTNRNDAKYVGYTYDNNGTETDSTIKTAVDTWYQTNILPNYNNYIEDTVYCNDREEATTAEYTQINNYWPTNNSIYYKSVVRVMNTTPSLECTNNADKYTKSNTIGNRKLTYPVGLLTMDEIWFAGLGLDGLTGSNNNPASYYLDNMSKWWSLSPSGYYDGTAKIWGADQSSDTASALTETNVNYDYSLVGIRPALSLKLGQNFEYGNGTGNNPYRFVATVPSS